MQILILSEEERYVIQLPGIISGRFPVFHQGIEIGAIQALRDEWHIVMEKEYHINAKTHEQILHIDKVYTISRKGDVHLLLLVRELIKPGMYQPYECRQDITIGRGTDNVLMYNNPYVSNCHAILHVSDDEFILEDCNSANHVYVNNKRFIYGELQFGDVVAIMEMQIVIGKGFISISLADDIKVNKNMLKTYISFPQPVRYETLPQCSSFRLKQPYVPSSFHIEAFHQAKDTSELPFLLKLGPSFMMGIVSITNVMFMMQSKRDDTALSMYLPSIFMAASMLIGMIFFPIMIHFYQKRKKQKEDKREHQAYAHYLQDMKKTLEIEKNKERNSLLYTYPSVQELWKDKIVWHITIKDSEFLKIRFATGNVNSQIELQNNSTDDISMILSDVPLVIDLQHQYLIGVKGTSADMSRMFYQILFQLVVTHSMTEVRIAYIGSGKHRLIRWLPHMEYLGLRTYFENEQDTQEFIDLLKQNKDSLQKLPLIIFAESSTCCEKLIEDISHTSYMGITIITFSSMIYSHHQAVIDMDSKQFFTKELPNRSSFQLDEQIEVNQLIRYLANCGFNKQTQYEFPEYISFLSLYNVRFIEELNIWYRWEKHLSHQTLKIPIGIQKDGQLLSLDIHEKKHGPHGIIAGMTGSGKSECLLTVLLSLAIQYHPDDVSFIIIDYKGGGLAKLLEQLPHTAGILTNLDDHLLQRTFIALECEIKRRQELLKEAAQCFQIANISLCDYQRLFYEGKMCKPLSHLVIVCDEFAELKMQQPFYMEQMISIARIGRSLGIHLILATQKPSGIINDQIWSNTNFHLCLKVAQRADSMDMLKKPDAASLTAAGRFYLQIGNEHTLKEGQSAWTQAEYDAEAVSYPFNKIVMISNTGKAEETIPYKSISMDQTLPQSQLEVLLTYINQCAEKNHSKAYPIWLPPLGTCQTLSYLEETYPVHSNEVLIGELDDPYHQCYQGLSVSLMTNSILYGNEDIHLFLKLFVTACKRTFTLETLHIYLLDLANDYSEMFPACELIKGRLHGIDEQSLTQFFQMMIKKIEQQKNSRSARITYIIFHGISALEDTAITFIKDLEVLIREGMKCNIHFLMTANHANDIHYRLQHYFTQSFLLDMTTKEEYENILQQRDFHYSEYACGKGFIKRDHIYEFRLAQEG